MCSRSLGVVGGSFLARRPYAVALGLLLAAPRLAPLGTLGLSARPASRFAATGGNERRQRRSANAPPPPPLAPRARRRNVRSGSRAPRSRCYPAAGVFPKTLESESAPKGDPTPPLPARHTALPSGPSRRSTRASLAPRRTGGAEGSTAVKAASRRWRGGRWRSPGVLAPGSALASTVAAPPRAPPSAASPDSRAPSHDSGARGARQRRRGCGGGQRPPCAAWLRRCAGVSRKPHWTPYPQPYWTPRQS